MEMIIGGAFQGKSLYAKENYPRIHWEKGSAISEEELFMAEGVLDFQDYIRKETNFRIWQRNCSGKIRR